MPDLISRLSEKLDEVERVARDCPGGPWQVHENGEVYAPAYDREVRLDGSRSTTDQLFITSDSEGISASVMPDVAAHIASWDPHSVLRLVAAHREVIAEHQAAARQASPDRSALLWVIRTLARVYGIEEEV